MKIIESTAGDITLNQGFSFKKQQKVIIYLCSSNGNYLRNNELIFSTNGWQVFNQDSRNIRPQNYLEYNYNEQVDKLVWADDRDGYCYPRSGCKKPVPLTGAGQYENACWDGKPLGQIVNVSFRIFYNFNLDFYLSNN